eukprot:Nk52_evm16s2273 gene=Nk52_evmTU16s2273
MPNLPSAKGRRGGGGEESVNRESKEGVMRVPFNDNAHSINDDSTSNNSTELYQYDHQPQQQTLHQQPSRNMYNSMGHSASHDNGQEEYVNNGNNSGDVDFRESFGRGGTFSPGASVVADGTGTARSVGSFSERSMSFRGTGAALEEDYDELLVDEERKSTVMLFRRDFLTICCLFYIPGLLTCGIFWLVCYWRQDWYNHLLYYEPSSTSAEECIAKCEYVRVTGVDGVDTFCKVERLTCNDDYLNNSNNSGDLDYTGSDRLERSATSVEDHTEEEEVGHEESLLLQLPGARGSAHLRPPRSSSSYSSIPNQPSRSEELEWAARKVDFVGVNNSGDGNGGSKLSVLYFEYRRLRYIYNGGKNTFEPSGGVESLWTSSYIHDVCSKGLTRETANRRKLMYGQNQIDIEVKPVLTILVEEVLHPFYMFQVFSMILWYLDDYYYYAMCIFVISVASVGLSLYETRVNLVNLRNMALFSCDVTVLRDSEFCEICSTELVPGDVIVVQEDDFIMPCDAVVLQGSAVVNESMLTGESVPVSKNSLPYDEYSSKAYCPVGHSKYTLHAGTSVIQTRYYGNGDVLAMVTKTGFLTSKGALIRSILFPKPNQFAFYRDAFRFVLFLCGMAFFGFVYSITNFIKYKVEMGEALLRSFDIITTVVPPALPAAMTVGTVFALGRLKDKNIFCISPPRVNVCGKLKVMCFDKTGTLTQDGLDVKGALPAMDKAFCELQEDLSRIEESDFLDALASCHSLTIIGDRFIGDPLDIKMFESTRWQLEEPVVSEQEGQMQFESIVPTIVRPRGSVFFGMDSLISNSPDVTRLPHEVGIIRQFHFTSQLQRMSVIVKNLQKEHLMVFTKGAPEVIKEMCDENSIPDNFGKVLHSYTHQGLRVLGVAGRALPGLTWLKAHRVRREKIERNLTFYGFLIMQNLVKEETTPVIQLLNNAKVRNVMVTGDNALTAVSVARECELISDVSEVFVSEVEIEGGEPVVNWYHIDDEAWQLDPETLLPYKDIACEHSASDFSVKLIKHMNIDLAVTGKAYQILTENCPMDIFEKVIVKASVFARMSPDQKQHLVESLQDIGYTVGFCGDGANDCGALKSAHVGISLSEAEASVAAPFTYTKGSIACIPEVIREGRAALVTSFSVFKYMAMYSFIQFMCILQLYSMNFNLGDFQYLYMDLLIIMPIAISMSRTHGHSKIVVKRPPGSLASPTVIISLLIHILIMLAFQAGSLVYLRRKSWYVPYKQTSDDKNIESMDNTVLFIVASFQYIWMAMVLSISKPYRKPLHTNRWFLFCLVVLIGVTFYITLCPDQYTRSVLQLWDLERSFRYELAVIVISNLLLSWGFERKIVTKLTERGWFKMCSMKKQSKNRYKYIERTMFEVNSDPNPRYRSINIR